jgi:ABC-type nitrate/sulfonate/bicarbonate transport system ATPase subunit
MTATVLDDGLRVQRLEHGFGDLTVLDALSLHVAPNEVVGLVGPSGCGKSTLLELIGGLASPRSGTISVSGAKADADRLAACAYMPQRDTLLPWLRAIDNAALGPRLAGSSRTEARELARPMFERLGLAGFERARPDELSGGMRQRVAFARTLLTGKPVLLLDEPFAALDAITRADLQGWLCGALAAEPRTTVLVSHDVEEALFVADRVLVLSGRPGRIVWEGAAPALERAAGDRAAAVTASGFVQAREQALHALESGLSA